MKSLFKYTIILVFFGICHFTVIYPQSENHIEVGISLKRNAIYGSAGMGWLCLAGSWYSERIVDTDIFSGNAMVFLRIGSTGVAGSSN